MLRSLALLAVVAAGARAAVSPLTPATAAMGSSQTLTWTADPTRARRAAIQPRADPTIDMDEHGDLASLRQQPGHDGCRRGHLGSQRRDNDLFRARRLPHGHLTLQTWTVPQLNATGPIYFYGGSELS